MFNASKVPAHNVHYSIINNRLYYKVSSPPPPPLSSIYYHNSRVELHPPSIYQRPTHAWL